MNNKILVRPVIYGLIAGATGFSVYCAYRLYNDLISSRLDEGFVDSMTPDPNPKKHKVLVLGLDGSGKSHLLAAMNRNQHNYDNGDDGGERDKGDEITATSGCSVVCTQSSEPGRAAVNFWEVGGGEQSRMFWANFVEDTRLLVYVVDSGDASRFSESYRALHDILADTRLSNVPILVVANKQDMTCSEPPHEVLHALGMDNLSRADRHAGGDVFHVGASKFDVVQVQAVIDKILH